MDTPVNTFLSIQIKRSQAECIQEIEMEMLIASLSLGLMALLVKNLHGEVSAFYILWFRSLLHILFLTPFLLKGGIRLKLQKAVLFRGICGFLGMSLYFISLQHLPLMLATTIFWAAPLFTMMIAGLYQKRGYSSKNTQKVMNKPFPTAELLIATGIVLLFANSTQQAHHVTLEAIAVALLSSFFIGGSYFFLGQLGVAKEDPMSVTYSFSQLILVFSTPFALASSPSRFSAPMTGTLIAIAGLAMIYQFFIARAYQRTSVANASALQAVVVPVLSIFLDRILYQIQINSLMIVALGLLISGQLIKGNLITGILFRRRPLCVQS